MKSKLQNDQLKFYFSCKTNLHRKKLRTDAKMWFYSEIALAALFNKNFTLIKFAKIIEPHDYFLLTLMQLRLGLFNEDITDRFDISFTK